MITSTAEMRKLAAEASPGISADVIYATVLSALDKIHSGVVLDFGAGQGRFAKLLAKSQTYSRVDAVDLIDYEDRAADDIHWIHCDLNEPIPIPDATYDVIAAVDVIEHLENVRAVAREWFRLLRPGGTLVFSTPNNESWRALLSLVIKGQFVLFTASSYPAHITALLRVDMERALTEAGFCGVRFSYTNDGGVPKLPHIKWQAISFGLLKGMRFSDHVVCTASKPAEE